MPKFRFYNLNSLSEKDVSDEERRCDNKAAERGLRVYRSPDFDSENPGHGRYQVVNVATRIIVAGDDPSRGQEFAMTLEDLHDYFPEDPEEEAKTG